MPKKHPNTLYRAGEYVKLRKRGGKYLFLDIYEDGKRRFETLPKQYHLCKDEFDHLRIEKAKQIAMQREKEVQIKGVAWLLQDKLRINVIDYFKTIAHKKNQKPYLNTLAHLKRFLGAKKWIFNEVTENDIQNFQTYLRTIVSDTSVHTYMSVLKAAFNLAQKERKLQADKNPFAAFDIVKRSHSQREYLTLEELRTLSIADCDDTETKRGFLFSCYTGLRLSDVRALTWKNVQNNRIEIRMKKTDEAMYLDLNDTAKDLLGKRGKAALDSLVFTLPEEKRLGRVLLRWAKNAGLVKHLTFHVGRHTFATLLLTHGTDIYTASKLLGHKDVKVTQMYAKIVDEKKKAAINSLPNL
jgi:integrase